MSSTVVIIDDNTRFRHTARAPLELEGYDVVGEAADAAGGGVEAVAQLRPDLVLLDIALPDLSGDTLAGPLR